MISANKRFISHFNSPVNDIYVQFKINNAKNQKDVDYFCFVEGSTDEKFYGSSSYELFSKNNIQFLYMGYHDENEYNGKKAVLLATKVVEKSYKKLLNRFTFIVDHDDFGIDEYKNDIPDKYLKMLTVLPVYSFENFYFHNDNLIKCMSLFLADKQIQELGNRLENFCDEIIDYYALKAVHTATFSLPKYTKYESLRKYCLSSKCEEIFRFNFKEQESYNTKFLRQEVQNLKSLVVENERTNRLYEKHRAKLASNKDYIKGKTLFSFLAAYLDHYHSIDIKSEDIIKVVNGKLEIDLDVILQK